MEQAFHKAYKNLNSAQRQAVDILDGPLLIIAGPGTGKTQLLALRIANILLKTDAQAENILCLTFTDSGALAMRDRLRDIIGPAAYGVNIATYHAFGSELLGRYPEYFPLEAQLQAADELTIDQVLRRVLAKLPYTNPLRSEIYVSDLKQLISDAKRALMQPEDLLKTVAANQLFIEKAAKLTRPLTSELLRISKRSVGAFTKLLQVNSSEPARALALSELWQKSLADALEDFTITNSTKTLVAWKKRWLSKDENGEIIPDGTLQNQRVGFAAHIYHDYLAELRRSNLYDYDDMILQAINGLKEKPELCARLQERYLYILLDEFQDTNEAQTRLVQLLTDSTVNEGRPNVMAVGDDDQAIYAFQGATYSNMLDFYHHYRDVAVITLTENYRSQPDILYLAGNIASQIESRLVNQLPGISKQLVSVNPRLSTATSLGRYEFKSSVSQNSWIAQKIAQLASEGVEPQEIAVLSPKHSYLEELVPYLRKNHLAVHYDKRENILDDLTIQQLIDMSRLVLELQQHPLQVSSLWSRILSYDFWELPTSLLWQISWQCREEHRQWSDVLLEHEETKPIALFFMRLSEKAAGTPMELMLDLLIGSQPVELYETDLRHYISPFRHYYFGEVEGMLASSEPYWQLLSNMIVLRDRLRNYRPPEHFSLLLSDFVTFVDGHQAAGIKIINTNPHQESAQAVELMTVYRAKGREFTAVFVLGTNDEIWGPRARRQYSRISLPPNLLHIRYEGETDDERLRLFYVALTRAKTQLYLTSFTSNYAGKNLSYLKYLEEYVSDKNELYSPLLPAGHQQVVVTDHAVLPSLQDVQLHWGRQQLSFIKAPEIKALLGPRLARYQLSATELNIFLDTRSDGPAHFFLYCLLRFPQTPSASSQYGSAMHETLQWLFEQQQQYNEVASLPQTLKRFQYFLERKSLGGEDRRLLFDRGQICLANYLEQAANKITEISYAEYNFQNEDVHLEGANLTGKIDKLIVDHKQRTITIVDYKTGKSHDRWEATPKLHFYRHQLYFYKLLVEYSRKFKGYKVNDAYLEFIEPDEKGRINELHLTFDDREAAEFTQLILACWQLIQMLEFPNVQDYSSTIKGITAFESAILNDTIK